MFFSWFFLAGFLRKVYGILTVLLLFTTVVGAIFLYNENVKNFVQERSVYISIHFFVPFNKSLNKYLQRLNFHLDKYANKDIRNIMWHRCFQINSFVSFRYTKNRFDNCNLHGLVVVNLQNPHFILLEINPQFIFAIEKQNI